jgi:hypothetical protein
VVHNIEMEQMYETWDGQKRVKAGIEGKEEELGSLVGGDY